MYSSNFLGMWGRSSFPSICKPDRLFLRKLDVSKGEGRIVLGLLMLYQDIDRYEKFLHNLDPCRHIIQWI